MRKDIILRCSPPFDFGLTASLFARFPSEVVDVYRQGRYYRAFDLGGQCVVTRTTTYRDAQLDAPISEPTTSRGAQPCAPTDDVSADSHAVDGPCCLAVLISNEAVNKADVDCLEGKLRRIFNLDFPLDEFYRVFANDPVLAPLFGTYRGLRMLVRPSLFEALVMAIVTQQINLVFAYTLKARLVTTFGHSAQADGSFCYTFPCPGALAQATVPQLREMQFSGRKAEYIIGLARQVASGSLELEGLSVLDDEAFIQQITKIRGLGRWSAEWGLSRGLGRPDVVAADDIGVQQAFSRFVFGGRRTTAQMVRQRAEQWRPYRSYAVQYLLMALFRRLDPWYADPD